MSSSRSGNAVLRADRVAWPEEEVLEPEPAQPFLVEEEERFDRRQIRAAQFHQWVQMAVLTSYTALVAVGIAFHEPWADEAQAWLLARDQGFRHLMLHAIRYEGSPSLWHALLWGLVRLHAGYVGMRWIAGGFALAGVYVLLRWSPFPLILKALLPFGFWLAYQDAVVARSYVLFAILAFPAAAILRSMSRPNLPAERSKLIWLAVLLGLMANLSIHGFIASIGFAIVALALLRRKKRAGMRVRMQGPAIFVGCCWLFVVVTVFPPSDVDFPAAGNLQMSTQKIWAAFGSTTAKAELADEKEAKEEGPTPRPGELAVQPPHVIQRTPGEARWHKIARVLGLLTFPVSNFKYLALVAIALVIAQALVFNRSRGQIGWVGLLPWALMVGLFTSMYLAPRHAGMLWEALIAALWLTWPAERSSHGPELWLRWITVAALVLVSVDQVQWTGYSLWNDIHQPYSGDKAMAQWLKSNEAGKRIAGFGYHSVGVTAWFDGPLYFNEPATYWIWSQLPRNDARAPITLASHPDVIVFGGWSWSESNADISEDWVKPDRRTLNGSELHDMLHIIPYAEAHGYRETHRFCGHAFLRNGYSEELCQVALQPDPSAPGTTALTPVTSLVAAPPR